ncbi:FHA domain-containing protein [Microbacterium sp. 179-B 1A2 NHS]|uniref:FHA domain-containing protein n=1 Tax=Microbacterium sp. 179-B 1A2 NHS TaxID=3142383 RepID=UPI00399F0A6B
MRGVRYQPDGAAGAWRAAVTGTALAVLPPEVTPHAVEAVWRRLDGGGIGAILESLTGAFGTSLTAIPPFGLAVAEGDGVRVAARGPVELIIETPSGPEAVSGAGVSTWTERFIAGATRVSVDLGADGAADPLPIDSGVVPIASLVLTLDASDASADARSAEVPRTAPDVPVAAAVPASLADAADPTPRVVEPPVVPEPVLAAVPVPEPVPVLEPEPLAAPEADPEPPAAPEADPEPLAAPEADPEPEPLAAPEANPESEPLAAPEPPPAPVSADTVAGFDDPVLGETIASPRKPATSPAPALLEVPAFPPFVAPAPPLPGQLGDHDGATISVAEARALRGEAPVSYESIDNVPGRSPSQGRIRLADGRTFELERTVIIGRRPRSTRPAEAELPTLIAVDGPQHDISRNHVEIRAEGEHVLAIDLASTNGTVLLRGGHDPVRLHPNEPTMVVNADVLDLGDGVTLTFEDLP